MKEHATEAWADAEAAQSCDASDTWVPRIAKPVPRHVAPFFIQELDHEMCDANHFRVSWQNKHKTRVGYFWLLVGTE